MYNDTVNIFAERLKREGFPRIFKKDILEVIKAVESGDYRKAYSTRLYARQGTAYCRLLEYINEDLPNLFDFGVGLEAKTAAIEKSSSRRPKFELGLVVITANADSKLLAGEAIHILLERYQKGDWGDTCLEDAEQNDAAVRNGDGRIHAVYHDQTGVEFWIITEWDRSCTTILLPEDY